MPDDATKPSQPTVAQLVREGVQRCARRHIALSKGAGGSHGKTDHELIERELSGLTIGAVSASPRLTDARSTITEAAPKLKAQIERGSDRAQERAIASNQRNEPESGLTPRTFLAHGSGTRDEAAARATHTDAAQEAISISFPPVPMPGRRRSSAELLSFLMAAVYARIRYFLIASNQYVSEFQFVVRDATSASVGLAHAGMGWQRSTSLSRRVIAIATAFLLTVTSPIIEAQADEPASKTFLAAEEIETLATARTAILELPEIKAATARFNAARKAYQEDRRKFPAERDKSVQAAFHKATAEYERAKREALLANDPSLKPLLEKEAAARKSTGRGMNEGEIVAESDHPSNVATRPINDVAGLPRVLLIGDSISIGYTLQVRKLLEGKANVHRIPTNGGATEVGLANIKKWLGDGKWDVIHFNFGLHDAKHSSPTEFRTSRVQYADNLRKLVMLMKPTGAKLIFATTTPVPKGGALSPTRIFDDIAARNELAKKVMDESGVAIDDLYAVMLPQLANVGRSNDVHFKPDGYDLMAKAVADSIELQLPEKN